MCKYCFVIILAFPLLNVNTFAYFHVVTRFLALHVSVNDLFTIIIRLTTEFFFSNDNVYSFS